MFYGLSTPTGSMGVIDPQSVDLASVQERAARLADRTVFTQSEWEWFILHDLEGLARSQIADLLGIAGPSVDDRRQGFESKRERSVATVEVLRDFGALQDN